MLAVGGGGPAKSADELPPQLEKMIEGSTKLLRPCVVPELQPTYTCHERQTLKAQVPVHVYAYISGKSPLM